MKNLLNSIFTISIGISLLTCSSAFARTYTCGGGPYSRALVRFDTRQLRDGGTIYVNSIPYRLRGGNGKGSHFFEGFSWLGERDSIEFFPGDRTSGPGIVAIVPLSNAPDDAARLMEDCELAD